MEYSVIIPTFNNGAYLPQAIDSCLACRPLPFEIIVVDDGSTDDTEQVMSAYGDPVRYIRQKNKGPACARNTGISLSRTPLVAFLDSDDYWLPHKMSIQLEKLNQTPDCAMVFSRYRDFDHKTGELSSPLPGTMVSGWIFDELLVRPLIALPTVVIKKEFLMEFNGFDETLPTAEDVNLWLKIARKYRIIGMEEDLLRRRKHPGNLSDRADIHMGTLDNLDRIAALYPEAGPRVHPPMKTAYGVRGTELVQTYFAGENLKMCRKTCLRLLKINPGWRHLFPYLAASLLPLPLVRLFRKARRSLVTCGA